MAYHPKKQIGKAPAAASRKACFLLLKKANRPTQPTRKADSYRVATASMAINAYTRSLTPSPCHFFHVCQRNKRQNRICKVCSIPSIAMPERGTRATNRRLKNSAAFAPMNRKPILVVSHNTAAETSQLMARGSHALIPKTAKLKNKNSVYKIEEEVEEN